MSDKRFSEFVAHWCLSQDQTVPEHQNKICLWLEDAWQRNDRRLLLMAFRNSGKSTLVGLFCAWVLSQNNNLRILVLAADHALARKLVRNVKRIIERHPMTEGLKPGRADQWASDQFTIVRDMELRDPSMLAKGLGANLTGARADVFICDDVEVPNTCDTATKREDLRERLAEIDYILVPGGTQIYVGTPHNYYTIYADKARADIGEDHSFLEGFTRFELPLLNAAGSSHWPERFPDTEIEAIRTHTGPNKFSSQMMLQPVNSAEGRLDPDMLKPYSSELRYVEGNGETNLFIADRKMKSVSCWWDPAYGAPGKGDGSVVAAVFSDERGDYWLHRVAYINHDPSIAASIDEATQQCRQVAMLASDLFIPILHLETNGLGKFLPGLLRRELSQAGIQCVVVEQVSKKSKQLRIIDAFDAVMAARRLHVQDSVYMTPFISEMREWRPNGKTPDDGLDAVSGCLLNEPVRLPKYLTSQAQLSRPRNQWRGGTGTYLAETEFKL